MEIIIANLTIKKEGNTNGRDWKIYEIETTAGIKYDTFDSFDIGEKAEVEVKPNSNPKYNATIKRLKLNKGEAKQEAKWDKVMGRKEESIAIQGAKRDAIGLTCSLINAKLLTDKKEIKPTIEYFFKYIYALELNDTDKQVKELAKDTGIKLDEPFGDRNNDGDGLPF